MTPDLRQLWYFPSGFRTFRNMRSRVCARCWITIRQAATDHLVLNERMDRFLWPHGWVEMPCAGIFEVHDGKITLWRDYFDLATYRNQLPG